MEKFKDILAWIIVAITSGAIFIVLLFCLITIIRGLFAAGLEIVVWIVGFIFIIFVISKIVTWASNRVL